MDREQIQLELALLGPERVRKALVAFEHLEGRGHCALSWCCVLTHAMHGTHRLETGRRLLTGRFAENVIPLVEQCFEGWAPAFADGVRAGNVPKHESRAFLRGEMLAFLAERGAVPEPALAASVA